VIVEDILKLEIKPLINKLDIKAKKFQDLFFGYSFSIELYNQFLERHKYRDIDQFIDSAPTFKDHILWQLNFLEIKFEFDGFKSSKSTFTIINRLKILFNEYYYGFYDTDDKEILTKLYHEKLTANDEKKIIKSFVDDLKDKIKEELKSPKS